MDERTPIASGSAVPVPVTVPVPVAGPRVLPAARFFAGGAWTEGRGALCSAGRDGDRAVTTSP
ncbi:hypothetical protein [Streptosporangium sp. NBC_01756]|uniref:hypothetical protein n=1 Tax=Streptosporangium sp. NBC_01756 TaxID=2975950 RepID=UPI002DD9319F|nr:hypothetical protein [Streptosporangium sp. NBC_01756]WSC87644.1 hypothetical protein OIE48_05375 [Streptosporangium sp. NBC_01756]